jgi:hypothetical protein
MPTESEAKLARYNTIEREADEWGRVIGVRRLKPSEQAKISGMLSDLVGFDEVTNQENGEILRIPKSLKHSIAATVCEINDQNGPTPIPLSRNRPELDAILDRLDDEGIKAATAALVRITEATAVASPVDEAKNLSGTPSSA